MGEQHAGEKVDVRPPSKCSQRSAKDKKKMLLAKSDYLWVLADEPPSSGIADSRCRENVSFQGGRGGAESPPSSSRWVED